MKKSSVFVLGFLLLSLFLISIVSAADCTSGTWRTGTCAGTAKISSDGGKCTSCALRTYCDDVSGKYRTCTRTDPSCTAGCGSSGISCAANQCHTTSSSTPCVNLGWTWTNTLGQTYSCVTLLDGTNSIVLVNGTNPPQTPVSSTLSCNATKCASKGNLVGAQLMQNPPECDITSGNCGEIGITSGLNNLTYDFWWTYYYNDGTTKQVCGCDGSLQKEGIVVSSPNILNPVYSFPFVLSKEQNKTISKISFRVAVSKFGNRSAWSSETNISVNYGSCENQCLVVGKKHSIPGLPNQYKICTRNVSGCFYLASSQTCNPNHFIFDDTNQTCVFSGFALTCLGANRFCNNSVVNLNNTLIKSDLSCSIPGVSCYECNNGFSFNQNLKKCINASCTISCNGNSYCGNSAIAGSAVNSNLTCCDEQTCYTCGSGTHLYNGSCVANACAGNLPSTNAGNGTLFGASTYLTGALKNWSYVNPSNTALGACEWSCNLTTHREINLSSGFNGCMPGAGACTSICSNSTVDNALEIPGTCVVGKCYMCNANFLQNDTGCSRCPNGQTFINGACQASSFCANGCAYNDGNKNICIPRGKRLGSTLTPTYCSQNRDLIEQKAENSTCTSNYECLSNYCGAGKCLDLLGQETKQTGFLQKILCYLRKFFGAASENCEA